MNGVLVSWAVTRGPSANPRGSAARGADGRSSARLRHFRRADPQRRVRRRYRDSLGIYDLLARQRRSRRSREERRDQVRRAWRTHARRLGVGAHAHEREARELAAHQGARRIRRGRRQPDVALPEVGQHGAARACRSRNARRPRRNKARKRKPRSALSCRRSFARSPTRRRRARTGSTSSNTTAIGWSLPSPAARARLYTRSGLDWTDKFAPIVADAGRLRCKSALLDGEAVVLDEKGVSQFPALVSALEKRRPQRDRVRRLRPAVARR